MAQALTWYGGKAYEYVDGSLQEVKTPETYTMPDGTPYTYNSDGIAQALPQGQTTAAPTYQGSGQGVPQWLIDANKGQSISGSDNLPLGGNTSWTVGNQVYSGTQWNGEGGAPWGSNTPGYYNYENTPALQLANQTGKISALNGSPYNTLDANGNVTGSGNWSNLTDSHSNRDDAIVTAIVGSIFGAAGAGALGGSAGATGMTAAGGEAAGYGATAIPAGAAGYGSAAGAAGSAIGSAAGATTSTGSTGGTFGTGGLGTGTSTGGSYGLGTTLGGDAAPYTYGGSTLYNTPYAWDAAAGATAGGATGSAAGSSATSAGTPPPANPAAAAGVGGLSNGQILGALTTLLGGGGGGGGGSNGGGAGGAGASTGGLDLNSILGVIGGGVDASQQGKAAAAMKSWLDSQNASMNNYMNPNSPEYNHMWEEMSRKDAAAGRNSQYGPRTSDFLANVAKAKADNTLRFTAGTSKAYSDALTMNANKYAGLSAALQRAAASNGGKLDLNSLVRTLSTYNGSDLGTGSGSTGTDNQAILNTINNQGGTPIDYGSDATDESAVWDSIINGWGF